MTICYEKDNDIIRLSSDEISSFFSYINDYVSIGIEATTNCGTLKYKVGLDTTAILDITNKFYIDNTGKLVVRPALFGLTTFKDGIYSIKVTIAKDNQWIISENCTFVDVTYSCKVGAYLKDLLEENRGYAKVEKIATNIHMLHYALVNGSNCGCNCVELCQVYNELTKFLTNNTPQNSNCGC